MRGMAAVMKRELGYYFYSPVAYSLFAMFLLVAGYFFYSGMTLYGFASVEISRAAQFMEPDDLSIEENVLRIFFANLSVVMLLMLPVITMRLFSEEKKSGSIEMLFTWPIRDWEILLGKYLAALTVFAAMLFLTLPYTGIIAYYTPPPWGNLISGYLGLFLMGASFISLGIFVSSLTENQVIAGAITFGAILLFWLIAWTVGDKIGPLAATLKYLSLIEHFDRFTKGVIDTVDIVYYLSIVFVFLFLTLRSLESKNWRGVR